MEFKLNNNYSDLLTKYIVNEELATEIQCNINFVEKHIDIVDISFSNDKDKQIAYKQLGAIAFSCVEALWKSIVMTVNKNCALRDCKEKCNYNQFTSLNKLNNTPPGKVLDHLVNMRLLYVQPFEKEAIDNLQNLRNHIHLTRALIEGAQSAKFNKQFTEDMLRLYYVTINQAEMNHWYYDEYQPCLRELDNDGYETTKKQQESDRKEFYTNKIIFACIDIFYKKPITEKNQQFLRRLSNINDFYHKTVADEIGKWLYFASAHFRTETQYQEALKNFRNILSPYLPKESTLLLQIDEQRKYYNKL